VTLSAILAGHLACAEESMKAARDALRKAAAVARLENIAAVDPEALETLAAVTDANRGGVECMAKRIGKLPPRRVEETEGPADA
jgi:hypothetical protein